MFFDALAFLIQSQKEKVGSMCGSVGMGDGAGGVVVARGAIGEHRKHRTQCVSSMCLLRIRAGQ